MSMCLYIFITFTVLLVSYILTQYAKHEWTTSIVLYIGGCVHLLCSCVCSAKVVSGFVGEIGRKSEKPEMSLVKFKARLIYECLINSQLTHLPQIVSIPNLPPFFASLSLPIEANFYRRIFNWISFSTQRDSSSIILVNLICILICSGWKYN